MIENEFKLMLTKEQYEKIFSAFSCDGTWDKEILQTNHYFDTDDLELSACRITVRVREIDGEYFLQMKLPTDREFSRIEIEQKLPGLPENIWGPALSAFSGVDGLPSVKRLGKLFTKRSVKLFNGAELDLDMSEYFDKRDYEVEIEFTDEEKARELLEKIRGIIGESSGQVVCKGKIHRFLDEFRERSK